MSKKPDAKASFSSGEFLSIVTHPFKFKAFLLGRLPAAFFSGVRVEKADESSCTVSVPYKWFSQNPFRSTYFACLAMAAEMSTGILAMAFLYRRNPAVSMLVTAMESKFYKKAVDRVEFTCNEGAALKAAIDEAVKSGNPQTVRVQSSGYNRAGEMVAEFWITWSFKVKSR